MTTSADAATLQVKDALAEIFHRRGVRHIFGNPGSTELTFLAGLPASVDYVMSLQEASVGGMALGFALRSGATPVLSLHTAPGLGNAIGALHNMLVSRTPAVVVVGQQDSRHLRDDPALSGDLVGMGRPVTKWAHEPIRAADVPRAFEKAFRIAESGTPGPTLLSIPMDFFEGPADPSPETLVERGGGLDPVTAELLAAELGTATSIALVTGARVELDGAWNAAIEFAERVGATVYSAPFEPVPGFPTRHPQFAHSLPFTRTSIGRVLGRHSHVLVLGASAFQVYPFSEGPLTADGARLVVISDVDAHLDGVTVPGAHLIASRIEPALRQMLTLLPTAIKAPDPLVAATSVAPPAASGSSRVSVQEACRVLADAREPGMVLVDESISSGGVLARHWRTSDPRSHLRSANGGLGFGLPAAVGAALAGDAPAVVCVVGDGSFAYSPQALWTAAQRNLPVKVVVLSNGGYKVLADYHRHVSEHLGDLPSLLLPQLDPCQIAMGFGVPARRASSSQELATKIEWLFGCEGPALLDIQIEWSEKTLFTSTAS